MKVYLARRTHWVEGERAIDVKPTLDEAKAVCVAEVESDGMDIYAPNNWDWVEKKIYPDDPGTARWEVEGKYYDWDVVEFEVEP